MKLILLFTTVLSFHVSASVFSQKINLNHDTKGETVRNVLKIIENESNVRFFYNDEFKQLNEIITLNLDNGTLDDMLGKICRTAKLSYKLMDNNFVVIYPSEMAQSIQVSGIVTDASSGEPIIGGNVTIEGTTTGVVTDGFGKFMLDVPNTQTVLVISFIGYNTEKVVVGNQSNIVVKLTPDIKNLEEVVVIGYGVQKKSDVSGAISQVKSADMENRTVVKVEQALQGKTSGVQIIQTSGAPSKTATVRVRGFSSNYSSNPLYVVDGLRTNDIGSLDPSNIESIDVLKDAASAAIYGAEAGNGVILITTKSGKKGAGKVFYDFQYSVNSIGHMPEVMNAKQYIEYMEEGGLITSSDVANYWDGKTDTNWADVAFENSVMQKHNVGIQGGNDKGKFYIALTNLNQDGIVKGNKDVYKRLTAMINADYQIKPWLKIGTTNTLEKFTYKTVSENTEYGGLLASVLTLDPLTPNLYGSDTAQLPANMKNILKSGYTLLQNENGDYYGISNFFESDNVHPMIMRDKTENKYDGGNVLGTIYADLTPLTNLRFTTKLGYRGYFSNSYTLNHDYYANSNSYNTTTNVNRTSVNSLYYQWENFANYDLKIGKHKMNGVAGISYSNTTTTTLYASGSSITKDDPLYYDIDYVSSSASKTISGNESQVPRMFSYFGRLSYDYDGKYYLQTVVRRDAADLSRLPGTNRWGTFPSISGGYVISRENFFPQNISINNLKIRGSWGQNGSLGPLASNPYIYESSITSDIYYPFSSSISYQLGSYPDGLDNPDLKWETSEQMDLGFDLNALNNRLSFTFDYYVKKTKDLLVTVTPTYETGVSSSVINAGNVENKGLEFELGWQDHLGDLKYSIRGNLATLKNRVTYLDESVSRIAGSTATLGTVTYFEVGKPVWYMRGYQVTGIDDATGEPEYKDQLTVDSDGDGKNDTSDGQITTDDQTMIGSAIPDFTYGLTLNAAYKGFDFTIFGTGSKGNDIFSALNRTDRPKGNKLTEYYNNRWTAENPTASRPRPYCNSEDKYWYSSGVIFDGSYFKIKQIQLGYTVPDRLLKKALMSSLRVYVSIDDWFVFTKYPGIDPEASAGSTSAMGLDKGSYPTPRKAVFGFNLTF